jgi:hypothetical protein
MHANCVVADREFPDPAQARKAKSATPMIDREDAQASHVRSPVAAYIDDARDYALALPLAEAPDVSDSEVEAARRVFTQVRSEFASLSGVEDGFPSANEIRDMAPSSSYFTAFDDEDWVQGMRAGAFESIDLLRLLVNDAGQTIEALKRGAASDELRRGTVERVADAQIAVIVVGIVVAIAALVLYARGEMPSDKRYRIQKELRPFVVEQVIPFLNAVRENDRRAMWNAWDRLRAQLRRVQDYVEVYAKAAKKGAKWLDRFDAVTKAIDATQIAYTILTIGVGGGGWPPRMMTSSVGDRMIVWTGRAVAVDDLTVVLAAGVRRLTEPPRHQLQSGGGGAGAGGPSEDGNGLGKGREPGRPPWEDSRLQWTLRDYWRGLIRTFPKLKDASLRAIRRSPAKAGVYEENARTDPRGWSYGAKLDGRKIEIDDINERGQVVDVKIRGTGRTYGREPRELDPIDIYDELKRMQPKSAVEFARTQSKALNLQEKTDLQLIRQARFSRVYGLRGVVWETNDFGFGSYVQGRIDKLDVGGVPLSNVVKVRIMP